MLLAEGSLDAEQDAMTARLDRVHAYARRTGLNHIAFEPDRPRTAIVAAGIAFAAVQRALDDLGLDEPARRAAGIRLVKLGMPWPLEREHLRELLAGVEQVLVVEDKLPFVESQIKEALYRCPDAPLVLGKEDAAGHSLLPSRGTLGADDVARALARVLGIDTLPEAGRLRIAALDPDAAKPAGAALATLPGRTPYFCSGCPHNASTKAADDQLVGAGIGCHIMVVLDSGGRGKLLGMPQMGGEGAQWLGLAPFARGRHFVQNLGDGTFHHSGSLAIRAAVAAGVDMTYKLLYNDAVAMTGGQRPVGRMDVAVDHAAARRRGRAADHRDDRRSVDLRGRGARPDRPGPPSRRPARGPARARGDPRRHRADPRRSLRRAGAPPAQARQAEGPAAARADQRARLRGLRRLRREVDLPVGRARRDADFGRKTQIHQGSCNQDFSCLKGDCPSFMEVVPGERAKTRPAGARRSRFPSRSCASARTPFSCGCRGSAAPVS